MADDERSDDLELETSPSRLPLENSPCSRVADDDLEEETSAARRVPDEDLSEDLASDWRATDVVRRDDLEDSVDCLEADKDRTEDFVPVTDDDVDSDCLEVKINQTDDDVEDDDYDGCLELEADLKELLF